MLAEAVASLYNLIKQDAYMLDKTNKQRLQRHLQKLTNATQLSFAERDLLQEHNRFLAQMNNEAKVRRSTKSEILGTARVMGYEDLEKARAERAAKEVKKVASITPEAEEATVGKKKMVGRGRVLRRGHMRQSQRPQWRGRAKDRLRVKLRQNHGEPQWRGCSSGGCRR